MKTTGDLAGSIGELVANGALGDGDAVMVEGEGRGCWLDWKRR
jgi:hypothetical protein